MTNRPKAIGTSTETKVVRCIRENGFGTAERAALTGRLDRGDITGTPGICWEVKGGDAARYASDGQVEKWLRETETERLNGRANIGCLVMARWRTPVAGWWVAVTSGTLDALFVEWPEFRTPDIPVRLRLDDWCFLLTSAGYGDQT